MRGEDGRGANARRRQSPVTPGLPPMVRVVLITFLLQLGLQATYFVGIIGGATYGLDAGPFEVSWLVLLLNVGIVLGGFLGGSIVDRFGPERTLGWMLAVYGVYGFVGWLMPLAYAKQLGLAALHGVVGGIGQAALDVLPRYLTPDSKQLLRMNSLNSTAIMVATMVGPLLGGLLAGGAGLTSVFALAAVAAIPAELLCWTLRGPVRAARGAEAAVSHSTLAEEASSEGAVASQRIGKGPQKHHQGSLASTIFEGVRVTFANRNLRLLFLIGFLGFFAYGAFDSLESLFYRDTLHASVDWMGILSTLSGVGATVGSLAVVRLPSERLSLRLLSVALLITGLGSMVYVGTSSVWVAAAGQVVCGLGFGAMGPMRTTIAQRDCEVAVVGRVTSFMRAGLNSAGVLPLLVAPFLAEQFGVQPVLFAAAVFVAATALVYVCVTRGE